MDNEERTGNITVVLSNDEKHYEFEALGVTFESTDAEILDALYPVLMEEEGFNIKEEQAEGYYTLKRQQDSKNIFVFPKSTAG